MLFYLLIPLMWLTGLSAGQEVLRWWLMVMLGLFGGGVLFSIYFYRLRGGGKKQSVNHKSSPST